MKKLLFVVLLLPFIMSGGYLASTGKEQPAIMTLEASEVFLTDVLAMATGNYNGQQRFYVFHGNSIAIYNEEHSVLSRVDTSGNFYPSDPVVDSEGKVYLINSATDEIVLLSPTGQWSGSFRAQERPYSLALLSDGNLVIASPNGGKLFHIYDTSGRKLRSFGDIKIFDVTNEAQNLFLNRGKVVVDSSDNIYFVFKYAPTPTVLKFSRKGKFISDFAIEGHSISLQAEMARKYLSSKSSNEVGSIVITNSATIDPSTGHLWICMNGSSKSGVVYEYSRKGKKLGEYSVIRALPSIRPHALTHVTDLLVRTPTIYLNVDNEIYSVDSKKTLAPGDSVFPQEDPPCPEAQSWPGCSANCPTGSCPASINCKAILQGQIGQGLRIVGSSCQSLGPGQGAPTPKPNGGCVATVTTCDTTNGAQVTHTTNQDCNPVKYKCSDGACVADCSGTFTTSNCNNTCASGGYGEPSEACAELPESNGFAPGGPYPYCEYPYTPAGYAWCCVAISPIVIDVLGNGYNLTGTNNPVSFDFNGSGSPIAISWTAPNSDDAFLVLDRNGNGTIDTGAELFGNVTPQPWSSHKNGFLALAEYDKPSNGGNNDGKINRSDAIFASLRLWQDTNHNGISETSELHRLPALNVVAIDLDYHESRRQDAHGNLFRYRAKVRDAQGASAGRWAWDVFFVKQ